MRLFAPGSLVIVLIGILQASLALESALAATYYVDAEAGNDSFNGLAATAMDGTTGPWRTLGRVTSQTLVPGDAVFLQCGQVWKEPLVIDESGTSALPIKVSSFPTDCIDKPLIEGTEHIPAHNWTKESGAIHFATLPINLVSNDVLIAGMAGWRPWSPLGDATLTSSTDCVSTASAPCLTYTSGAGTTNSLMISNKFALTKGAPYTIKLSLKAPMGNVVKIIVRRSQSPWDAVGYSASVSGTGAWQAHVLPFVASDTLENARLDIEVPKGHVSVSIDDVRLEGAPPEVLGLLADGRMMNIAHHPNRGYNPLLPESLYLSMSEDADQVMSGGNMVSTYVPFGADLTLPPGASLPAGTGIRIRTYSWILDERKLAGVSGNRLLLDQPSSYPLYKGWGYFLFGQGWMLDAPGEWHLDAATNQLRVWMGDSQPPAERLSVAWMETGLDLAGRSNLLIENLAIHGVGTGVDMQHASNVTLRGLDISDTIGHGIKALLSTASTIEHSMLVRTGMDAITAAIPGHNASGLTITGNVISESGLRLENGAVSSLPVNATAAVRPGIGAIVSGNAIVDSNSTAIWPLAAAQVADNLIERPCRVLDDCAGIYLWGEGNGSRVEHNLIIQPVGQLYGKPAGTPNQAQGIYLDEQCSGVVVTGNTVIDAENGIKLHNAPQNQVSDNTLYGNRRYQLFMQEQSNAHRANGDLWGNDVFGNRLFPTTASPSIGLETEFSDVSDFSGFDSDRFSILLSPVIASEQWATGSASYTLGQWQAATSNGMSRGLESHGSQVQNAGYAAYLSVGGNLLDNGDLGKGMLGWSFWNLTAPPATGGIVACPPGNCLHFSAGGSQSLLSSPNFDVTAEQWYRVAFDLKTGASGQAVKVFPRRGGGGPHAYQLLTGTAQNITGDGQWHRYAFTFKAGESIPAYDATLDAYGPRIDFDRIQPGQSITIANLEVVPLSPIETSLRTAILTNPSQTVDQVECPDQATAPQFCAQYVRFRDGMSVSWPYPLGSLDSEIIYSVDTSLVDGDGDGVADSQDACPHTGAGLAVNAVGCGYAQDYP